MRTALLVVAAVSIGAVLSSTPVWAQAAGTATSGSIWGKVSDSSGAVLPGVTVTASSPTLVRALTLVTNEQGIYRFPSLPPGDFTLKFELGGFRTLIRAGIQLTLAFTATVDVKMDVASLEESVTVTGQSPVVDAVNSQVRTSFSKESPRLGAIVARHVVHSRRDTGRGDEPHRRRR
jgi:hypothetical protein